MRRKCERSYSIQTRNRVQQAESGRDVWSVCVATRLLLTANKIVPLKVIHSLPLWIEMLLKCIKHSVWSDQVMFAQPFLHGWRTVAATFDVRWDYLLLYVQNKEGVQRFKALILSDRWWGGGTASAVKGRVYDGPKREANRTQSYSDKSPGSSVRVKITETKCFKKQLFLFSLQLGQTSQSHLERASSLSDNN